MKQIFYSFFFLIILISIANAQSKFSEEDIKNTLEKIFDLSKNQDYKALATHFTYKEGEEFKVYNYNDKAEAKIVKRLSKKIKAYLDLSDSYTISNISITKKEKLGNITLDILFNSGNQKLKITFVFVDNAGVLLLADFK